MALDDRSRGRARNKARNKSQELKGQVKEAAGRLTDDERVEAEGRADHAKADVRPATRSGTRTGGKLQRVGQVEPLATRRNAWSGSSSV